jgi:hypothetical protein
MHTLDSTCTDELFRLVGLDPDNLDEFTRYRRTCAVPALAQRLFDLFEDEIGRPAESGTEVIAWLDGLAMALRSMRAAGLSNQS